MDVERWMLKPMAIFWPTTSTFRRPKCLPTGLFFLGDQKIIREWTDASMGLQILYFTSLTQHMVHLNLCNNAFHLRYFRIQREKQHFYDP